MRTIFWIAEKLLDSQEGLCSVEFVSQSVSQLFIVDNLNKLPDKFK